MSSYEYSLLALKDDNIRLLHLLPNKDKDAPLQCELRNYSLQIYMLMIFTWHAKIRTLPSGVIVICRLLRHVVDRIEQVCCGSLIVCRGNSTWLHSDTHGTMPPSPQRGTCKTLSESAYRVSRRPWGYPMQKVKPIRSHPRSILAQATTISV